MTHLERLDAELRSLLERFNSNRPMARLHTGEIGVAHYASHLRQNYFSLRERPVLMALAASRLRMSRDVAKLIHKRAVEEIGHDQLALNDLAALGIDTKGLENEMPLAETTALLAWGHYQIQRLNPVGFIGTMYFLDFAPLYTSATTEESLEKIGVPTDAMSVIADHEVIGPAHVQAMAAYVDELVTGKAEMAAVLHGMSTTATLFGQMIEAAFDAADNPA